MDKTYISLFSSAGIGCYGFKQNGFKCVATNELIPRRLEIQRVNNKCLYKDGYIQGSIEDDAVKTAIENQISFWKTNRNLKQIDVVIATPPCQGMSLANHKKTNHEIKRNSLVMESIAFVLEQRPKFFIFENVIRFLKTKCTDFNGEEILISDAINSHLSSIYDIHSEVLNFKNYGSNSSRTRTLIIGVQRKLGVKASDFFPEFTTERTLGDVIGNMRRLKKMGEIDPSDIYHYYRKYRMDMENWIKKTPYGETAFNNDRAQDRPHRVVDGVIIENKSKNGDKYQRQIWEKVGPCIHTRNDILASQNTVHPEDNRVFSIRELMRLMSVPEEFKWSKHSFVELNSLTIADKEKFLKLHDVNIRQCLGEAVPTKVFSNIAKKIKRYLNETN